MSKYTDDELENLLRAAALGLPNPAADPEVRRRMIQRIKNRAAQASVARASAEVPPHHPSGYHLTFRKLAVAAALPLVFTGPLYYLVLSRKPNPPVVVLPPPPPFVSSASDERVGWLSIENQLLRGRQEEQLAMLAGGETTSVGHKGLVRGTYLRFTSESHLSNRVGAILASPEKERPSTLTLDEVVMLHATGLRTPRGFAAGGGLMVFNGTIAPRPQDDETALRRYLLAQAATNRMRSLSRGPAYDADLSAEARVAFDTLVARPQEPWPDAFRRWAAENVPPERHLLVIDVELDPADADRGWVRFSELDPRAARIISSQRVAFTETLPPLSLRRYFPQPGNIQGRVEIAGGQSPDEIAVTFRDSAAKGQVSLVAREPLVIDGRFGEGRAAEARFEARVEFSGAGAKPPVEFLVGGNDNFAVGLPPRQIGPEWQPISLPLDLSQVGQLTTGLTIATGPLSDGDRMTVRVRNAYIRPLKTAQGESEPDDAPSARSQSKETPKDGSPMDGNR